MTVPFWVALPPIANVEEKLLGAKTGIAVLQEEEEEESLVFAKDFIVTNAFSHPDQQMTSRSVLKFSL